MKTVLFCFYISEIQIKLKLSSSSMSLLLFHSDLENTIHGLIFSHLNYRNFIYSGLTTKSITHLQLVQNAAARLPTNLNKRDHRTLILVSLHLLLVKFRINFNSLSIVFKTLHGLFDLLIPYEPKCQAKFPILAIKGDCTFAIRGP